MTAKMPKLMGFISILAVLCMLCACSDGTVKYTNDYKEPDFFEQTQSGTVAENDAYILSWNAEEYSLSLVQKSTGQKWSTIPYDTANETVDGYARVNLHSPLTLWYVESGKNNLKSISAYQDCVNNGSITCEKIENGLRVTYYFMSLEISVSVDYELTADGFTASIPTDKITENQQRVYSISLLPYFVATKNAPDSYLFVPSGSGALIYTDTALRPVSSYSESVYGNDAAKAVNSKINSDYGCKLPVYGVHNAADNSGIFAVISSGAESAKIEATAADPDIGYSSAYATFILRGSTTVSVTEVRGSESLVEKYSDDISSIDKFTVRYFVMDSSADTSYNAMASLYRDYLLENGGLNNASQTADWYLNVLCGARIKKTILGVPYYSTVSVTSLEEASEIVEKVSSIGNTAPIIKLSGFGDYGLDIGKIAGGFGVSNKFGGKKELAELEKKAEENADSLYFNFDVIRFGKSSSGFSTRTDAAKSANGTSAISGYYDVASNILRLDYGEYGFIMRSKLPNVIDKLLEKAEDLSMNGLALDSLSSVSYSDYSDSDYYVKGNMARDVSKIVTDIKSSKYKVAVSQANVYAAGIADCVLGTPQSSSGYDALDVDIPFYQMVFKGYVPIYSSELNLSANSRRTFLEALKSGQGLGFSVNDSYSSNLMTGANSALAAGVFDDIFDEMKGYIEESADFLERVRNVGITEYKVLSDTLSKTVFENGTVVYVNLGMSDEQTPLGVLEKMSFIYGKE